MCSFNSFLKCPATFNVFFFLFTAEFLTGCELPGGYASNAIYDNRTYGEVSEPSPTSSITPTSTTQVSVSTQIQGTINADFMGFSYEKAIVSTTFFSAQNAPLVALYAKWGPGVIRIGGNSVNTSTWTPAGAGLISGQTSDVDVDRLAGFLRATNWKAIYGLNDITSSANLSASEASYVVNSLGDRLEGFEIGNEPDVYKDNGLKPNNYTLADFLTDWLTYVTAITALEPSASFVGSASGAHYSTFTIPFAQAEQNRLKILTQHYYRADGTLPTSTMDLLLSPDPVLPAEISALSSAAQSNGISQGFRMGETNSFSNGGAANVSNAFGTALWAIEYGFTLAENGAEGANFHGGANAIYAPIAYSNNNVSAIRPLYYGMFFFSMMGAGDVLETTVSGAATALFGYTVKRANGTYAVMLVNNSRTDLVSTALTLPSRATTAEGLLLTAPSLDATAGMTLGGSTVGIDGSWSATTTDTVFLQGSTVTISIPAGSAYLLRTN